MAWILRTFAQTFTGVASEDFNTWLTDNYELSPPAVPEFVPGTFPQALERAQQHGHGVLVWLHERRGPLTDALVQQVWASPEVLAYIRGGRLICWAGDVCRFDPMRLVGALRVRRFPTVALLWPMPAAAGPGGPGPPASAGAQPTRFRVAFVVEGDVGPHHLMQELQQSWAHEQATSQLREMADAMMRTVGAQADQARRQNEEWEVLRRQEAEELPLLSALYESEYDGGHPAFLETTFTEAMAEAKRQDKLLLAWLRSPGQEVVDSIFGMRVWPSDVVRALCDEHFLLWAGDVERWIGAAQLRQVLQLQVVPALVVLLPMNVSDVDGFSFLFGPVLEGTPCEYPAGTAWQVVSWLDVSNPDALGEGEIVVAEFLCNASARMEDQRRQAEDERLARRREAEEWRALREAQDAEYEDSLRKDREAEARRQAEKADAAAAAEAAAAAAPAVAPEPEPLVEEPPSPVLERRRAAAARFRAEAASLPSADGSRCRLVIRLPSGRRVERTFDGCALISTVYDWADCSVELEELAAEAAAALQTGADTSPKAVPPGKRGGLEVPEEFLLCVTFPRQPLLDKGIMLRDAGLCPNAVLALSPVG